MTIWHEIALGICLAWTLFSFYCISQIWRMNDEIIDFLMELRELLENTNER